MKSLAISAVALSSVVVPALSADLKVVNFASNPNPRNRVSKYKVLQARAKTDQVSLSNQQNLYAINLKVGTPAQNISVQIDTGSSDLWFPVTGSSLCRQQTAECDSFGSYASGSSTFKNLQETFSISYGDGTQISGTFVTDNIQIGSDSLKSVQFAACSSGSSKTGIQGILGIGYETNEASAASSSSGDTYPNLLASMQSQGFINTLAYSLWLNDPDAGEGNVLFGGVDTAKYTGSLVSMPVVPNQAGNYNELLMPLTAIAFSADGKSFTYTPNNFVYAALIDSGTTLMYLPDDVANAIAKSLGAEFHQGAPFLPCSYAGDSTAKMTFTFNGGNGAKIDVLLTDLLADAGFKLNSGQEACELLVSGGAPSGLIILGDSFMRSAYIVYDLTNNMIAIAQSKFNTTDTNVQEISSSGIPSASVMSTLAGATAVASTATDNLPGSNPTAVATGTGGSGALETTATVPTFSIAASKNAAPVSARSVPTMSIYGVLASTVTLLSVFGGALMIWL